MRIVIFTNNHFPRVSGVAVAVDFLESALVRLGHDVLTFCPNYGVPPERTDVAIYEVPSLRLPDRHSALPLPVFDRLDIQARVEEFRPDVIHSHHPFLLGEAAVDAADLLDVPLCYTFHTLYEFWAHYVGLDVEPVRKMARDYVADYTNRCDVVISPTEPLQRYITGIGCQAPIVTIPTGLDLGRFGPATAGQLADLRARLGLDRFDEVVLSVGRITEEKNPLLSVAALDRLVQRGHNVALLFFGKGPAEDDVRKGAETRALGDRVIFGGFLDQERLAVAYRLGDVFVFPSPSDTQALVLYEALAAGLPVAATPSMAAEAAVRSGHNGIIAPEDPDALADALERILADPAAFTEPLDPEELGHERIGRRYTDLYRRLVERGRQVPTELPPLSKMVERIRQTVEEWTGSA